MGDIGGIYEVFSLIIFLLLLTYPEFSFTLKALEKLFLAKSTSSNII